MTIVGTLSWLLYWTALGLCLGSFLNVVIYRIPRNRSLRNPLWSACPHCSRRIHWYDNIPVLSFIFLGGRCRRCGVPIASRYIVIELMMALIVLILIDAFFIGHVRDGLSVSRFGLTDRLAFDWPVLISHIILFACLLAMSAIDLEHYWVDIRFTNLVTICGFILHILWTPKHSDEWIRPFDTTSVVTIMALVGLGLLWLIMVCQPHADPEDLKSKDTSMDDFIDDETLMSTGHPSLIPPSRVAAWVLGIVVIAILGLLFIDASGFAQLKHTGRGLLPFIIFFFLIVAVNLVLRPSDQAIAEAIYEERLNSRKMVLTEFMYLLPALIFGIIGFWFMRGNSELAARISNALHYEFHISGISMMRHWSPLDGLATAASGYMIAGSLGWTVRIFFTLLFGKEAFGTGDIHMMAAAGCVAGWPIVVIGFFLTCMLALLGWIISLPFKRTRALPLGPWLSLSFLIVVVFYKPIISIPFIEQAIKVSNMLFIDNSQPVGLELYP